MGRRTTLPASIMNSAALAELLAPRRSAAPPHPPAPGGAADDDDTETDSERLSRLDKLLDDAAKLGTAALQAQWATIKTEDKTALKVALDRRHKPTAATADAALAEKDA
jgi:hypothetical protein